MSRDPIGVWGDTGNMGNEYAYAWNRPLVVGDSLGLQGGRVFGPAKPMSPAEVLQLFSGELTARASDVPPSAGEGPPRLCADCHPPEDDPREGSAGEPLSTLTHMSHYMTGDGEPFDIVEKDGLSEFKRLLEEELDAIRLLARQKAFSLASQECQNISGDVNFWVSSRGNRVLVDLTWRIFWFGRGTLFWGLEGMGMANRETGEVIVAAKLLFSFRDKGADPLDCGVEPGYPYDIIADWSEDFWILR